MGRSSQTLQLQTLRRLPIAAMSCYTCSTLLMVVVIALIPDQTVSLPHPQPSISFQRLGEQKDNLIRAAGGIKQELFSPLIGIKRNLIDAKTSLIKTKLGLVSGIVGAKANIARGVLRPVFGIKRGKLLALRGLIDRKINLLAGF